MAAMVLQTVPVVGPVGILATAGVARQAATQPAHQAVAEPVVVVAVAVVLLEEATGAVLVCLGKGLAEPVAVVAVEDLAVMGQFPQEQTPGVLEYRVLL